MIVKTTPDWKLGSYLATYDSLLDGLTFDDLILTLHCNYRKEDITPEAVRREIRENILGPRLDDLWFLVENNLDKIIEYATDYHCDR